MYMNRLLKITASTCQPITEVLLKMIFLKEQQTCSPCRARRCLRCGHHHSLLCGSSPHWDDEPSVETRPALLEHPAAHPWATSRCSPAPRSAPKQDSRCRTILSSNTSLFLSNIYHLLIKSGTLTNATSLKLQILLLFPEINPLLRDLTYSKNKLNFEQPAELLKVDDTCGYA